MCNYLDILMLIFMVVLIVLFTVVVTCALIITIVDIRDRNNATGMTVSGEIFYVRQRKHPHKRMNRKKGG